MTAPRSIPLDALRVAFANRLQENVQLANYTTAHAGGKADAMLIVHDASGTGRCRAQVMGDGCAFYDPGKRLECAGQRQRFSRAGDSEPGENGQDRCAQQPAHRVGRIRGKFWRDGPPGGPARPERSGMGRRHPRHGRRSGVRQRRRPRQ